MFSRNIRSVATFFVTLVVDDELHGIDPRFHFFRRFFIEGLDRVLQGSGKAARVAALQELDFFRC